MCRKPSQTFTWLGTEIKSEVLLTGAGVLTDVCSSGKITAATNPVLILRDGNSPEGKVLFQLEPTAQHYFGGMNLEFQNGLFVQFTPGAGPLFGVFTVGGYIQDRSPDNMSIQLQRIADELARVTAKYDKQIADFSDFVKGLQLGDPAK